MADHDAIDTLERHLVKCEAALTEFSAIDAQLRDQRLTPHVADMIRVNRDTSASMERSMELIRLRLAAARALSVSRAAESATKTAGELDGRR